MSELKRESSRILGPCPAESFLVFFENASTCSLDIRHSLSNRQRMSDALNIAWVDRTVVTLLCQITIEYGVLGLFFFFFFCCMRDCFFIAKAKNKKPQCADIPAAGLLEGQGEWTNRASLERLERDLSSCMLQFLFSFLSRQIARTASPGLGRFEEVRSFSNSGDFSGAQATLFSRSPSYLFVSTHSTETTAGVSHTVALLMLPRYSKEVCSDGFLSSPTHY